MRQKFLLYAAADIALQTRISQSLLVLVFAAAIFIGYVAVFVGFKKDNLPDAFVDVDA